MYHSFAAFRSFARNFPKPDLFIIAIGALKGGKGFKGTLSRGETQRPFVFIYYLLSIMRLDQIIKDSGLNISSYESVHGGDINQSYCLHHGKDNYFLKVNDAERFPSMLEKEANGLDALRDRSVMTIPQVIKYGIVGDQQYLLLEWIEPGQPQKKFWENFGYALAQLHQHTYTSFGWQTNNFIGCLQQDNSFHDDWHTFYAEQRIIPLVKRLIKTGAFSAHDLVITERVCQRFKDLFPLEPPAFIHGDLWSGNYLINKEGGPVLIDPAVYFGHREMDIGMTRLFGGFDEHFYQAYQEVYPLEKGWEERLPLTQLYPLLVHARLFGGQYVASVKRCLLAVLGLV
jgi:protein-ribulosamine 3-kinase